MCIDVWGDAHGKHIHLYANAEGKNARRIHARSYSCMLLCMYVEIHTKELTRKNKDIPVGHDIPKMWRVPPIRQDKGQTSLGANLQSLLRMRVIPVGNEGPQRAEPLTGISVSECPLGGQLPGELPGPNWTETWERNKLSVWLLKTMDWEQEPRD